MRELDSVTLPVQDLADGMGLPLTDHQLQGVTEGDQPALAGKRAHLAHVIHIDDGVAVDALKLRLRESILDVSQALGGQEPLPGGNNPYQFPLGLERQYVVCVEQNVVGPGAASQGR